MFSLGDTWGSLEEPASPNTKSKKNWVLAILIIESLLDILTFTVVWNMWDGITVAICLFLGWFGYKGEMNQVCLDSWSVLSVMTALVNFAFFVDDVLNGDGYFFSTSETFLYNFQNFIGLVTPITLIAGGVLGWHLYMNQDDPQVHGYPGNGSGGGQRPQLGAPLNRNNFQTFSGTAQRLGND